MNLEQLVKVCESEDNRVSVDGVTANVLTVSQKGVWLFFPETNRKKFFYETPGTTQSIEKIEAVKKQKKKIRVAADPQELTEEKEDEDPASENSHTQISNPSSDVPDINPASH